MGVNCLGAYHRMQRMKRGQSLSDVQTLTGIDASRLCRIELGRNNEPSPTVLKQLSVLYKVDLLYLFKIAGFIDENDVGTPFYNYESLNIEERNFVQQTIDFLVLQQTKQ